MRMNRFLPVVARRLLCVLFSVSTVAHADVYFSEYIEGSSNNKALEIFNPTDATVDLSAYEIQVYFNGSTNAGLTIALQGSINAGDVFVLAHSSSDAAILTAADQTTGSGLFNGDDAVALLYAGSPIDVIGQIGIDPGTQWGTGDIATANKTLRRKISVAQGDADGSNAFDPALEWDGFAQDSFDDLGIYSGGVNPEPTVVLINEVDSDTPGADTLEFIELFDGGQGNISLDGYTLVLFNGSNDLSYRVIDLTGYSTNAEGYLVVGNEAVSGVDIIIPANSLQNGADAIALYQAPVTNFPNNSVITLENLIDAAVYGTSDATDLELLALLNSNELQIDENSSGAGDTVSNQRCANGSGGLRNTASYVQALPTPGAANQCAPVIVDQCGAPATKIHTIQGNGLATALIGSTHSIEGVVVGDFQGSDKLNGFFVQEEDRDVDGDPLTSEGIFVFDSSSIANVNIGDVVRVNGSVSEFFELTQITATNIQICSSGASVTPTELSLPVNARSELEALEGMAIIASQTLTVSENFNLGRYGELVLSANGRMLIPTQVATPGANAQAVDAANQLRRILLDDASTPQNPEVIPYPAPELSAYNTVRTGDTVKNLRGVLHYGFSEYRIQPTATPIFIPENARTTAPELPGTGSLKIASFNVLNYFNGDGLGGGFPTSRGAHTVTEFERQRAKIINALITMNADVVGLVEIENDGYGPNSAIQDLVNGLHDAGLDYAVVNSGVAQIGTDEITGGFIYKPATIDLVNAVAILDSSVDARFIDTKNRPVLAQTFREKATLKNVTVAVAHLKSKGSDCNDVNDPDTGDGQGNCNITRTAAAQALTDWLATNPTQVAENNFLIMGDLNAYAKEDPIVTIENAGYINLIKDKIGEDAYSYVFSGASGYLDHALANNTLHPYISSTTEWHINADEPRVLDYNEEFKTPAQVINLYGPEAYRASDHDPVIVEINFPTEPDEVLLGDFNNDQQLNGRDLALLVHKLGKKVNDNTVKFDLNKDGRISLLDIIYWSFLFADYKKHH